MIQSEFGIGMSFAYEYVAHFVLRVYARMCVQEDWHALCGKAF
jgi:hypothetical protein